MASNSSSLPSSQFIDEVEHPERVLNTHPHSALGMLAPSVFAERWRAADDCEPAVT